MHVHYHFLLKTVCKLQSSDRFRYAAAAIKSSMSDSALVTFQCIIIACVCVIPLWQL